MKNKLIKSVLSLSLIFSFFTGSAENYITKQEINVRSGPGTSFSVEGIMNGLSCSSCEMVNFPEELNNLIWIYFFAN